MNWHMSNQYLWTLPVWAAETTLIAMVLAAAAGLGSHWRRLGPSARHLLWLVVLIRLVMPPVVHWPWAMVSGLPGLPTPLYRTDRPESPVVIEPSDSPSLDASDEAVRVAPIIAEPFSRGATNLAEIKQEPSLEASEPTPSDSIRLRIDAVPESRGLRWAGMVLLSAWLIGTLGVAVLPTKRILAFHRRLMSGSATPAPAWLMAEAASIAQLLNVRPPSAWVVSGLSTPMLWCLGRPRLLVPRHLLAELEVSRWRGILVHELAHLRRGDHWVSRLELAAELVWWWNPIYRLVRRRIDAEAELACDAWVVSLLPEERLNYADSLFRLCSKRSYRSTNATQAPALGVVGSGQFFEKRLTMILRESVTCRASAWNALVAALLMLMSAPAWTLATPPETTTVEASDDDRTLDAEPARPAKPAAPAEPARPTKPTAPVAPVPPVIPAETNPLTVTDPNRRALNHDALFSTFRTKEKPQSSRDQEKDEIRWEMPADDVEAKMEAFADKMEAFAEKMEEYAEKTMGEEFERRMEAIGLELEKTYGPGSDFEKAVNRHAEGFKADASRAVERARSAAETARRNKKLAESLANETKRLKQKDQFTTTPNSRASEGELDPTTKPEKARFDAEQAKSRVARDQAEREGRFAHARAIDTRAHAAWRKDRDRKIRLIETKLQQLMRELKQLESEDGRAEE